MSRDAILVDTTQSAATQAALLKQTVAVMRNALNLLGQCKSVATHLNDGAVFTDIETRFGVPAGQGQNVFNLINGAYGSTQGTFQVSDFQTMVDRLV